MKQPQPRMFPSFLRRQDIGIFTELTVPKFSWTTGRISIVSNRTGFCSKATQMRVGIGLPVNECRAILADAFMINTDPALDWYASLSAAKGMPPRCPFASVHRCPRFYQSLSLLSKCGSTDIEAAEDEALFKKWSGSDLGLRRRNKQPQSWDHRKNQGTSRISAQRYHLSGSVFSQ